MLNDKNKPVFKKILNNIEKYRDFIEELNKIGCKFQLVLTGGALRDLIFDKANDIKDIDLFFNIQQSQALSDPNVLIANGLKKQLIENDFWNLDESQKINLSLKLLAQKHGLYDKWEEAKKNQKEINNVKIENYNSMSVGVFAKKAANENEFDIDMIFALSKENVFISIEDYFDLNTSQSMYCLYNNLNFQHNHLNSLFTCQDPRKKLFMKSNFLATYHDPKSVVVNLENKNSEEQMLGVAQHLQNIYHKYPYSNFMIISKDEKKKEIFLYLLEKCILSTIIQDKGPKNQSTFKI